MEFKAYKTELQANLPPALDANTTLQKIVGFEPNTFKVNNVDTKGMYVLAIDVNGKSTKYRTSSKVIMTQIEEFFKAHPNETIDNVRVIAPRGKQYLTLESV